MSFAKLFRLKEEISDVDIIRMLAKENEIELYGIVIRKPIISQNGVSGDFGEPAPI
ncbi:hypothetical protein KY343_04945 [Candidatus Woesearchaeota archaeon]|nr:hypothetical protein [Candidatus Woesearchaeota archaeon]